MKLQKQKGQKKCIIKRHLKFRDYKKCLKASQIKKNKLFRKKKLI